MIWNCSFNDIKHNEVSFFFKKKNLKIALLFAVNGLYICLFYITENEPKMIGALKPQILLLESKYRCSFNVHTTSEDVPIKFDQLKFFQLKILCCNVDGVVCFFP